MERKFRTSMFSFIIIIFCINCHVNANDLSGLMIKASCDFFSINMKTDLPQAGLNNSWFEGIEAKTDGLMIGGTLYIGYLDTKESSLTMFELSRRSGSFETSSIYTRGNNLIVTDTEVDRSDQDIKLTYQWIAKKFQPYIGIGYQRYKTETKESLPFDLFWTSTERRDRNLKREVSAWSLGGGFGAILGDLGPFTFSLKSEVYQLFNSNGELNIEGSEAKENSTSGTFVKATFLLNIPFSMKNSFGSFFVDNGWQFQKIEFDSDIGEDKWQGFYGRFGFSLLF